MPAVPLETESVKQVASVSKCDRCKVAGKRKPKEDAPQKKRKATPGMTFTRVEGDVLVEFK